MWAKDVGFVAASATTKSRSELDGGAARRLAVLGLIYGIGLASMLVMSYVAEALGRTSATRLIPAARPIAYLGVALGAAVYLATPRLKSNRDLLGAGFEVAGALVFSFIEVSKPWPASGAVGIPVACLWIVICAMLVPLSPRMAVFAAFAAATTGPLAAAVLALAGRAPAPSLSAYLYFYIASYVAAAVSYVGARVLAEARTDARLLGSYRLAAKIGEGGMGEVWRAQHHVLAHPAAVKLVRIEKIPAGDRTVILKRFEREAQMTAGLTSPHTVRLFDYGVASDGIVYYVMELIEGMDLERMIERHGPLPPERAVHFLAQACLSLAEAHAAGLVHRDIKPSNLFCCKAGLDRDYIKVLDFGLVRPVSHLEGGLSLTKKGIVMGTPGFIAPEVALGRADVDHRSDLYSLACVAYYLMSGDHVFDLRSPMRALHDHAYNRPVDLARRATGIPPALSQLVMSCLAKNPAERPADAETLAAQLRGSVAAPWDQARARAWWLEAAT